MTRPSACCFHPSPSGPQLSVQAGPPKAAAGLPAHDAKVSRGLSHFHPCRTLLSKPEGHRETPPCFPRCNHPSGDIHAARTHQGCQAAVPTEAAQVWGQWSISADTNMHGAQATEERLPCGGTLWAEEPKARLLKPPVELWCVSPPLQIRGLDFPCPFIFFLGPHLEPSVAL